MPRFVPAIAVPVWRVTPTRFIWLFALANVLVFHGPLWAYLNAQLPLASALGVGVLVVLVGLSLALSWLLLGPLSLISPRLLGPVVGLWVLGNAVALYAMHTYRVVLDKTMMGNVWHTDRQEAWGLFHPLLLLYVLLALLALAWLSWRVHWRAQPRLHRLAHGVLALVLSLGAVFSQSAAWLWVDQHAKVVGGLLLPWSYGINSWRHWAEQREQQRVLPPLPALAWAPAPAQAPAAVTVVLVIGESARAANFSLYGYERATNERLQQRPVLVLPGAQACATYTRRAIECMLSHEPGASRLTHETLPDYLARSGQVQVVWRTRNWGEPPLRHVQPVRSAELSALCRAQACPHPDHDETLLLGLPSILQNAQQERQLIVLHQSGSHGPAYHSKYPEAQRRFLPECTTVDLRQCGPESLRNAYDNSVLYTDTLLDRLIALLAQQTQRRTVLIYVSDHGESLGEGGWYLHGAPDVVAPREQKDIPFLVWLSPNHGPLLKASAGTPAWPQRGPMPAPVAVRAPYGQGHVFHTVLGALGASSPVYRPDWDVLAPWRAGS